MLKTAILFAVGSLVIALLAPQIFRVGPQAQSSIIAPVSRPLAPAAAQTAVVSEEVAGSHEAVLHPNSHGQYVTEVLIKGQPVPMLVDTGASFVSLSWQTAMRLGVSPESSGRRYRMSTANGEIVVSAATVSDISFQGIYMRDVEAIISPPEVVTADLLGSSFIRRLASVEQRDGLLILHQ